MSTLFRTPLRPWYLPLSGLSHEEGLAFTFFRQHTTAQLQDGMRSQLWDKWALQISHQEPAVCADIADTLELSADAHPNPRSSTRSSL